MTTHRLDPTPDTTADVLSRDHAPVLCIDPDETVVVRSLDASGFLERQTSPGEKQPMMYPAQRGHCLTGPIMVRGAEPGDLLALRLVSVRPDPWGWTVAAARDTPVTDRLGLSGDRSLEDTVVRFVCEHADPTRRFDGFGDREK